MRGGFTREIVRKHLQNRDGREKTNDFAAAKESHKSEKDFFVKI